MPSKGVRQMTTKTRRVIHRLVRHDLVNERFGLWHVLSYSREHPQAGYMFKCRCYCGAERLVAQDRLLSGRAIMCIDCKTALNRARGITRPRPKKRKRKAIIAPSDFKSENQLKADSAIVLKTRGREYTALLLRSMLGEPSNKRSK